jgi:hypothetical protein
MWITKVILWITNSVVLFKTIKGVLALLYLVYQLQSKRSLTT